MVEHPLFEQGLPHAHGVRTGENTCALQHQPVHQLRAYTALSDKTRMKNRITLHF